MKDLNKIINLHGGYWRYDFLDFYYLFNSYFPTKKMYQILAKELPVLVPNYPSKQKTIAKLLSQWSKKKYFNENNLVVSNGSSELIRVLNNLITKIAVPIPTFNEYVQLPKEKMTLLVLEEGNEFRLDPDELIRAVKKTRSDFTVINNPNNPTGNVVSRKDIEKILKIGVMTIVDEAFVDFSPAYSVEDLVPRYKNLIVIKSLTKTMGAGGLRFGYLLTTNQKIKERVRKELPIWNINSIAERLIELFPSFKEDYKKSIQKTIRDRASLLQKIKEIPYLEPYPVHANFIFCRTEISSQKLAEELLNKYNILIKYGLNQKNLKSDNYIRLGIRKKKDNDKLISALKSIKNA